ncbi:hypothetical protein GCM10007198_26350 [Microbacterium aerolatum]|uniref:Uncharacterized protein n=1 Tax=Microbacterium aerolatum TaxID=153731 RepID=A0A511AI77_9MICO|nr:hypothetical protein MAE01_28480 [Microbacterium aerolatum]GGB34595.1 hypothetical protein GCM10007198_26350 [Microbacterium aerolatum]
MAHMSATSATGDAKRETALERWETEELTPRSSQVNLWRGSGIPSSSGEKKGPSAHPAEPGYPCYVSVLGELAWMLPRGEPQTV